MFVHSQQNLEGIGDYVATYLSSPSHRDVFCFPPQTHNLVSLGPKEIVSVLPEKISIEFKLENSFRK